MDDFKRKHAIGFKESVALMALMISLVALSIDTMLPALPEIGRDLGVERANDNQLVVSLLILGLSIGQMFYGPLSDAIGRKPAIYIGFGVYIAGCILAVTAARFPVMLAGRVLQGLGAAGPRIVTVAVVRDQYEGRAMAQVMSIIMSVFIFVPVVAPALGQIILLTTGWRAIFGLFLALAAVIAAWFAFRQPETLPVDRRIPFSPRRIATGVCEVCAIRRSLAYTLAAGFIFGAFFGYLNSAQQIFQDLYGLGPRFPLFFGVLALSIGGALFSNTRLVMRFGMRLLIQLALLEIIALSIFFFASAYAMGGKPPLWSLMAYLLIVFFGMGVLFGNLHAVAMEPLGHIAGIGAAVVASLSTFISVPLGIAVGQFYNGTVLPLIGGFAVFGTVSFLVAMWSEWARGEVEIEGAGE